jgi:O-antigen biosynthesis protein
MTREHPKSMPKINPLDYPVTLAYPRRLAPTSWAEHIPFAMFLVDVLRPEIIVELGTLRGVSYCAFCQAVKELELSTRCFAVDNWRGDELSGFYDAQGAEILSELKEHHDPLYQDFSQLIQSSFDDALSGFENGTIDLLHIDGCHSYEAVKHDFESWLPKMSERGVVLLHDIHVRERGFGVWKLWEELKTVYPHFEFVHEHGLGVVATGAQVSGGLREIMEASEEEVATLREFFHQLGHRLRVCMERDCASESLAARERALEAVSEELAATREQLKSILNSRAWRWVSRYGRAKARLLAPASRLAQNLRRAKDTD